VGLRTAPRATGRVASRSRSFLVRTTISRTRSQWRLLLAVAAVATLASVLVTSLSLLVAATEQGGVRGALVALPEAQTSLHVRLLDPTVPLDDAREGVVAAAGSVLGDGVPATSSGQALSRLEPVGWETEQPTLAYFGELDGITSHATLTAGEWARAIPAEGDRTIDVALPTSAAAGLSVGVGGTIAVTAGTSEVTARVVGLYRVNDIESPYWATDRLAGRGFDSAFADPSVGFYRQITAFGPLIGAPGALDAAGVPLSFLDLTVTPDFSAITVDGLQPLLQRLSDADTDIPLNSGSVAGQIFYDSEVAESVSGVAAGLVVTRSTVIVVSLLLAVLAIAALSQVARLFMDARSGERQLLRARGASRAQIFLLTLIEAGVLAVVVGAVTPPLAGLVYRAVALQPPMRAAGMPTEVGIPPATWLIAAAIAIVFVVVLVAPLWRKEGSFVEGEQSKGRQRATSGLMHSGVDVALVALAAIAFWQLQSYRTPVQSTASLTIDPVLVVGPALALIAAALICVRLIPAASRVFERIGAGTRGSVAALAAWEIGRRSQRATAAVLLLSLTLGVATFGLVFLSTWKQSQLDQAALAVGAPVRVEAADDAAADEAALAGGARGAPEPALRRSGAVSLGAADVVENAESDSTLTQVLAITTGAAELMARGRSGEVGGEAVRRALSATTGDSAGIDLPRGAGGLTATVVIADLREALPGVTADIGAVVEQPGGALSVVSMGRVDADGLEHRVAGPVRAPGTAASPGRMVGLQARFTAVGDAEPVPDFHGAAANLLVRDLAWTDAAGAGESLSPPVDTPWVGVGPDREAPPPVSTDAPAGWQLRLEVFIPPGLSSQGASYALVGWSPRGAVSAVLTKAFARSIDVTPNATLGLRIGGIPASIRVDGLTPLVPGAPGAPDLLGESSSLGGSVERAETIVVDYTSLAHALVEGGAGGALVDEWWVDVVPGTGRSFVDSIVDGGTGPATSAEVLGLRLQEAPLRVATQAALWVAITASAALAAVGFGVQSAASLRSRRLELAQLRAIGFSRRRLVGLSATESLLMSLLGVCFGVGIGLLLAWLVGPLVAVSPNGSRPVPSVIVQVPGWSIAALVLGVVVVLTVVVAGVARVQRFTEPAHLLREGAQA
jgi:hypothetical protein